MDDLVFALGCSGSRARSLSCSLDDVVQQIEVTLEKTQLALQQAGTTMDNVLKTVLYLKNMEDYKEMETKKHDRYRRYALGLIDESPVDTMVGIMVLNEPDTLMETEALAVLPDKRKYSIRIGQYQPESVNKGISGGVSNENSYFRWDRSSV